MKLPIALKQQYQVSQGHVQHHDSILHEGSLTQGGEILITEVLLRQSFLASIRLLVH